MGRARREKLANSGRQARPPAPALPARRAPAPLARPALALLLLVTALTFQPALSGDFLSWDDRAYVTGNRHLQEPGGLRKLWDPNEPTRDQYYPLLFTSYWAEYRIWQDKPFGYHAVNLGLHLGNVVLVALLGEALGASAFVALGAAAAFAVHPLQVASVAWIAERKNVLSGFFYLGAFLLYLRHRRAGGGGAYAASLAAFVAALLSKTQTVTLPASLLLTELLLRGPARLRSLPWKAVALRLGPMLAVGVVATLVTARVEHANLDWTRMPPLVERPVIAANAAWFYLGKFLLPLGLSPVYARWDLVALGLLPVVGLVAWPLVVGLAMKHRQRIGDLPIWGGAHFLVALAPVLGLVPFGLQQHSFVADHFMYLAILGAGVILFSGVERLGLVLSAPRAMRVAGALAVLLTGSWALWARAETAHWKDDEVFWQHTLESNPDSLPGRQTLAFLYRGRGRWDLALPHFRRASELRPEQPRLLRDYLAALRKTDGPQAVVAVCDARLRENPAMLAARLERAQAYEALGNGAGALVDYEEVLRLARDGSEESRQALKGKERLAAAGGGR